MGVCDKETFGDESEGKIYDSDSDFASDLAVVSGNKVDKSKNKKKEKNNKEEDDFDEEDEEEFEESGEEEENDEELDEEDIDSSDFSVDSDHDEEVESLDTKLKKRKNMDDAQHLSSKRKKKESESEKSNDEFDSEDNEEAEDENESIDGEDNSEGENDSLTDEETKVKDEELQEDIYGRLKDKKGNVVSTYKPPHLRNAAANIPAGKNQEKLQKLRRQLKGLLNRLAENNMNSISNEVGLFFIIALC